MSIDRFDLDWQWMKKADQGKYVDYLEARCIISDMIREREARLTGDAYQDTVVIIELGALRKVEEAFI